MGKKIKVAKRHTDLPKPYNVHVMAEIERQTARGAVIAGTAYLDLLLRSALESVMPTEPDILAALFENRGALEGFSARIQVAYALGVIGAGAYSDLYLMRDIRNAFAHTAESLEFETDDIAEKCRKLWYPLTIIYRGKLKPVEPRDIFIRGVQMLAQGLYQVTHPVLSKSRFIHLGPKRIAQPSSPKTPTPRVSRGQKAPSQKS